MGELYTRELIDDWLEYKQDKCIRSDEMDDMIDCTIKLLRSYITSHKTIAERDAEIKKQADYIASCKRDGAYWWREASGLGTKNVNLQAQLAEREAEIEAHEKREVALQMQVTRLEQSVSDMSSDYHRAFNENMAYLAFVEADDALEEVNRNEPHPPSDPKWGGWLDMRNVVSRQKKEAREQLRSVIDGMD